MTPSKILPISPSHLPTTACPCPPQSCQCPKRASPSTPDTMHPYRERPHDISPKLHHGTSPSKGREDGKKERARASRGPTAQPANAPTLASSPNRSPSARAYHRPRRSSIGRRRSGHPRQTPSYRIWLRSCCSEPSQPTPAKGGDRGLRQPSTTSHTNTQTCSTARTLAAVRSHYVAGCHVRPLRKATAPRLGQAKLEPNPCVYVGGQLHHRSVHPGAEQLIMEDQRHCLKESNFATSGPPAKRPWPARVEGAHHTVDPATVHQIQVRADSATGTWSEPGRRPRRRERFCIEKGGIVPPPPTSLLVRQPAAAALAVRKAWLGLRETLGEGRESHPCRPAGRLRGDLYLSM